MNDPITGIAVGASTAGVSLLSWLQYSGTVLGTIGALFGCLTAIGGFYHFVIREIRLRKELVAEPKAKTKAKTKAKPKKKSLAQKKA